MKFIKDLIGHSGCRISLYSSEKGYFIRKISKSIEYNPRLKKQMLKQIFFADNLQNEKIRTPKIINQGYSKGLFFFDMEFIKGLTLIEYIFKTNLSELKKITGDLLEIISLTGSKSYDETLDLSKKFSEKITELKKQVPERFYDLLEVLKKESKVLPKKNKTFCHGDLVLENIIYDPIEEVYYLIDFQDVFIEHYWMDISLIFQDIDEAWYMFKHPELDPKIMKIKMDYIKNLIFDKIEKNYIPYHPLFISMKFFRIIPYTLEKDHEYLEIVISKNLSKLSKDHAN
jgi:thiamine kinase-like enzyme